MKIVLIILSTVLTTIALTSNSAVLAKDGKPIFDSHGRLMMPDRVAIEKLKELGISPRDAVNLTRFIKTDKERLQKIHELALTKSQDAAPIQKKKAPTVAPKPSAKKADQNMSAKLTPIEIVRNPISMRPHLFRERDLKSLALSGPDGYQLAAEIRSKKGLIFNMETVRPHVDEVEAVKTFLRRHQATTSLAIRNLKEDILIKVLKSLAREGFNFTALKELNIRYHDRDRGLSANTPPLIKLFSQTMPHLTSLDSSFNQIGDASAQAISTMRNLTTLNISHNNIGVAGAQAISTMHNLTSLNISFNNIGVAGAQAISTMRNLTTLDISANHRIGVAGVQAISTMRNLTTLDISSNRIEDAGAQAISTMHNLTNLNIVVNPIGVAGAQAISSMHNLTTTCIFRWRSDDFFDQVISTMQNLTSLYVSWGVTAGDIDSIRKKMPNLRYLNGVPLP